jgi:hypothetical protein
MNESIAAVFGLFMLGVLAALIAGGVWLIKPEVFDTDAIKENTALCVASAEQRGTAREIFDRCRQQAKAKAAVFCAGLNDKQELGLWDEEGARRYCHRDNGTGKYAAD